MFVWVMRAKGSEWRTVRRFVQAGVLPFTPLVEAVCEPFIPSGTKVAEDPVSVMSKLSAKVVPLADSGRVWVDFANLLRLFSPNDVVEMVRIANRASGQASRLILPVVRTSSPPELVEAILALSREARSGLCIRVDGVTHLRKNGAFVQELFRDSGLDESELDFVFDAQDLPRAVSHAEIRDTFPLVENARVWATVAGTFPPSITDMSPDAYEHMRERGEWVVWRDEIARDGNWRRPMYGDYATQPAIYSPSPPFPGSPSVRYTIGDQFVILRGRGGMAAGGAGASQFIGHARFLRRQAYYRDVVETPADLYIEQIASGGGGTGNLTTWRVASLERHLSVVASQVASFEPVVANRR